MYNDVMTAIDSAIDKIVDSKEVVLTVVSRLLSQASADYQDSVIMNLNSKKYRVVELREYQDVWGFLNIENGGLRCG